MEIDDLDWNAWNRKHITKHGCTLEDVEFVCYGDHALIKESYKGRLVIAGPNPVGRCISVIIGRGPNSPPGLWYPFSARPSTKQEQRKYEEKRDEHA